MIKITNCKAANFKASGQLMDLPLEHIDIEINHRCNLSCRHCSAQAGKGKPSDELSVSGIKKVFDEARGLGLRKVGLTGGEPLYDINKLEAVATYCLDDLKIPLHTHTNGTLVTETVVDRGILSLFEAISVTFLGGDAKTHDYMTAKKGAFDKTFNAAKLLAAKGFPMSCYFIPTHGTCQGFEHLAIELQKVGARRIRAMALAPSGRARPIYGETAPLPEEMEKFEDSLLRIGAELGSQIEAGYCTRLSMPKMSVLNGHELCMSGMNRVHINSKGEVFPCTAASGVKELRLGNLKDDGVSLSGIWQGSELIRRIRLIHHGMLKACAKCPREPKCQFGCTVNAIGTMAEKEREACPVTNLDLAA